MRAVSADVTCPIQSALGAETLLKLRDLRTSAAAYSREKAKVELCTGHAVTQTTDAIKASKVGTVEGLNFEGAFKVSSSDVFTVHIVSLSEFLLLVFGIMLRHFKGPACKLPR